MKRSWCKRAVRVLVVALLAVQLDGGASAQDLDLDAAEEYIASALENAGVPGAAVGIVHGRGLGWSASFGVLGLDDDTPVNCETIFAIGSCTKAFTAASLLMLEDEQRVDLDRPASSYLPSLQFPTEELTRRVTLRDLLSHRTGLPGDNLMFWNADVDRDTLLSRIRFLSPTFPLGQRFQYQNVLYLAAGEVVSAIAQSNWDDFVTARILLPLGMNSTHANARSLARADLRNVASAHIKIDGAFEVIPLFDGSNVGPAGSIHSSVEDMARFVSMLLRGGVADEHQIISQDAVRAMYAPEVPIAKSDQISMLFPFSSSLSYGLGWLVHDYHGHRVVEHGGTSDGMSAWVLWMPENDLGVIVLTNSLNIGVSNSIAYRIVDDWLEIDPAPASKAYGGIAQQFSSIVGVSRFKPSGGKWSPTYPPERCVGRYANALYGNAEVRLDRDRRLTLALLGREGELHDSGGSTFQVDWGDDLFLLRSIPAVRFVPNVDRNLDSLMIAGQQWPRID